MCDCVQTTKAKKGVRVRRAMALVARLLRTPIIAISLSSAISKLQPSSGVSLNLIYLQNGCFYIKPVLGFDCKAKISLVAIKH